MRPAVPGSTLPTVKTGRLNHIDALRGSVMLLLVPYHGLLFLQNTDTAMVGLDFSVFWLHLWRMGLFFAVSGFLAAMTLGLWGPTRQLRQRLKRIGIPLVVAMLTILPAQKLIVFWFFHENNPVVPVPRLRLHPGQPVRLGAPPPLVPQLRARFQRGRRSHLAGAPERAVAHLPDRPRVPLVPRSRHC